MIVAVLLAAGSAQRFGAQKLLATLPDGRRVIAAAAGHLAGGVRDVIAVARKDDELLAVLAACGCRIVVNARADEGMGTSLAAGVRASREASAWLVALGDMPFINPQTIVRLVGAFRHPDDIVVPVHDGRRGHPVLFGGAYADALMALTGDHGARGIVERHADRVREVAVDDPGIFADIDTPADLALPRRTLNP